MGEAKRRGTREQRVATAIQRYAQATEPVSITKLQVATVQLDAAIRLFLRAITCRRSLSQARPKASSDSYHNSRVNSDCFGKLRPLTKAKLPPGRGRARRGCAAASADWQKTQLVGKCWALAFEGACGSQAKPSQDTAKPKTRYRRRVVIQACNSGHSGFPALGCGRPRSSRYRVSAPRASGGSPTLSSRWPLPRTRSQ